MSAEFDFITRIRDRTQPPETGIGIGDDCAVFQSAAGCDQLVCCDLMVEGTHFDPAYCSLADVGYKCLVVNLSDIAAMGGVPRQAVVGLALPGSPEQYDPLVDGLVEAASRFGVTITGGDTVASPAGLSVSVTVLGEVASGTAVLRTGARPGDGIWVTGGGGGSVGDSALGLEILRNGGRITGAGERTLATRHLRPEPRLAEGRLLAEHRLASAMIDISDGLLADLAHIVTGSGVGAEIDAGKIPLSDALVRHLSGTKADPLDFALTGGEDFELLFTVPRDAEPALGTRIARGEIAATRIGVIAPSGETVVLRGGKLYRPARKSFEHFA